MMNKAIPLIQIFLICYVVLAVVLDRMGINIMILFELFGLLIMLVMGLGCAYMIMLDLKHWKHEKESEVCHGTKIDKY